MFNSSILDVIIGLVFCFASVALFASSVNEAVASALKWRHKTLLAGLQRMLNDPSGNGIVKDLYAHALINPLTLALPLGTTTSPAPSVTSSEQTSKPAKPDWNTSDIPAYIASKDFAIALIDVVSKSGLANLKNDIGDIKDPQLRQVLTALLARADGELEPFGDAIANWFDSAMDRLSGSYKRRTQVWTFGISLLTAVVLNVDAIHVFEKLWVRPGISAAISSPSSTHLIAAAAAESRSLSPTGSKDKTSLEAAMAGARTPASMSALTRSPASAASNDSKSGSAAGTVSKDKAPDAATEHGALTPEELMKTLNTLPVGWGDERPWRIGVDSILGLLITASAAMFGAPFWFDLLQQLIQIRGTGTKPATNRDGTKQDVKSHATP